MKKAGIFILAFLFLANTSIASVWAQSCMHDTGTATVVSDTTLMDETLPCHQTGHQAEVIQEADQQHCKNLCVCVHVTTSSSLALNILDGFHLLSAAQQLFAMDNDTLVSATQTPLEHPPKDIS